MPYRNIAKVISKGENRVTGPERMHAVICTWLGIQCAWIAPALCQNGGRSRYG